MRYSTPMKIRLHLLFITLLFATSNFYSQVFLTAKDRALIYHVYEQSPVVQRNTPGVFQYKGDTIWFTFKTKDDVKDSVVDFDSISGSITYEPMELDINVNELDYADAGVKTELVSKAALYKLYSILKTDPDKLDDSDKLYYEEFLRIYSGFLPEKFTRIRNGKKEPSPKVIELLDPNLYFIKRMNLIRELSGANIVDQHDVLNAIFNATKEFVNKIGEDYYQKIMHENLPYKGMLLAAGDGSGSAGLFHERELIFKPKHKLGDPKGVGLFTYQTKIQGGEHNKQEIKTKESAIEEFDLIPKRYTTAHLSIWGFNYLRQASVVIKRDDRSYMLYASKLTKELSADSTFGKGVTIHTIMNKLEFVQIPAIDESINGKEGIKNKVEALEEELQNTLISIKETEYELDENRYAQQRNQKKIKFLQGKLTSLYGRKAQIEKYLANAEQELKNEEERMQRFRARLKELKEWTGTQFVPYTRFGYLTVFEDGITFNEWTQNFTFPDSLKSTDFSIRLIAVGPDAMADRFDEVQLNIAVTVGKPEDDLPHNFSMEMEDVFKPDYYKLEHFKLKDPQHFELAKLLRLVLDNNQKINLSLLGGGVGTYENDSLVSSTQMEYENYGETEEEKAKTKEAFKDQRKTLIDFKRINNELKVNIRSFTDPVKSNFSKKNPSVKDLKEKYADLTENQFLSVFRTYSTMEKVMNELVYISYMFFNEKDREKLVAILSKVYHKATVKVADKNISGKELNEILHKEEDEFEAMKERASIKLEARELVLTN